MVLSKKRITKAMIRLHGCTGWSAPVLFANPRRQVFSRLGPNMAILVLLFSLIILRDSVGRCVKIWAPVGIFG